MENTFEPLVGKILAGALFKQKIEKPTPIQLQAIPQIMEGKDVIASSETGTGKTLAYLLPIFYKLDLTVKHPQAFIITPTHELSAQVYKQTELLAQNMENGGAVKSALIIGGASISRQLEKIKEKPQIIIGSAGRILEIIKMKKLSAHFVKTIVLDEADKLVDENNIEDVKAIIKTTLKERQILVFSASVSDKAEKTAAELMGGRGLGIMRVFIENKTTIPEKIEHDYFYAERRDKIKLLRKIVHIENVKKAIVFINDPYSIKDITERFIYHGLKAGALYGGALKNERRLVLSDFRNGRINLLIASDIAARGLDVSDITHIINFDAPEEPREYLHRAGRTGRMGAKGTVITIVDGYSKKFIQKYEKAFNIKITEKAMSFGKAVDTNINIGIDIDVNNIGGNQKNLYKETKKNERTQSQSRKLRAKP